MARRKRKGNGAAGKKGGNVALSDALAAGRDLVAAVKRSRNGVGARVQSEINGLNGVVERTSASIAGLCPEEISGWRIDRAVAELDAVIRHTEEAAEAFLGAAEELEELAGGLSKKKAAEVRGITTRMFEASNFQDIAGQRLGNAKRDLADIETCISAVMAALGHSMPASPPPPVDQDNITEADLLAGPQHADEASSQEDVDAILASFD